MPLFSIVIPVCNVEKYIKQCLDSVVSQGFQDMEVICVDDGSTDSSGVILDEYALKYPFIRVIHKTNGGYGHAMNMGMEAACGEYISIVESDDYIHENMYFSLADQIDKFDHRPDMVRGTFYRLKNGFVTKDDLYEDTKVGTELTAEDYPHLFEIPCNIWSGVYKRDFLVHNKIRFLETPGASYQDTGFWFKVLVCAKSIVLTKEPYIYYRMDNENSSIHSDKKIFCVSEEMEECKKFLQEKKWVNKPCVQGYYKFLYRGYEWNYQRLGPEGKSKFFPVIEKEFSEMVKNPYYEEALFAPHQLIFIKRFTEPRLISFDVFDTLITRSVAHPFFVFRKIQEELQEEKFANLPRHLRDNFYQLRIHAEELARFHFLRHDWEEVTLSDIYRALALIGEMKEEAIAELMNLEVQTEQSFMLARTEWIDLLKKYLHQGKRCVLISDMYLSEKVIRTLLQEIGGSLFDEVPIYVSSELGVRKKTGNIYRKVSEIEKVSFNQWTHFGDNKYEDYEVPNRLGMTGILIEKPEKEACSKEQIRGYENGERKNSLESIANRLVFQAKASDKRAYSIGAKVAAPLLWGYINWLIEDSIESKIDCLYFIARDGYLLKKIADQVIEIRNLNLKTKYIYGSRRAWRYPSLTNREFNLRELVYWSYIYRAHTVDDLAKILRLPLEELIAFLPYGCSKAGTELSSEEMYELVQMLEKNDLFKNRFLNHWAAQREESVGYLKQEIDIAENYAFVDVSGGGLTQRCLQNLMSEFEEKPILTYFFKLDRIPHSAKCKYRVYFPSMIENNLVLEMICHAPHGQTTGYIKQGEKYVPILEEYENTYLKEHGFFDFERGVLDFTSMALREKNVKMSLNLAKEIILFVAQEPSLDVLEYFATFPNNETGNETSIKEYAPRLSRDDILNLYLRKMPWEVNSDFYSGTNLSYSVLRCSDGEKALIQRCKNEYHSEWGITERKEKTQAEERRKEKYKRAAYYPIELLERRIILYGAGVLGRSLHERIREEGRSQIVGWVDKMTKQDADYPAEVSDVSFISDKEYDQIVIAVMKEEVATEIANELEVLGVPNHKIFWRAVPLSRSGWINWEARYEEV